MTGLFWRGLRELRFTNYEKKKNYQGLIQKYFKVTSIWPWIFLFCKNKSFRKRIFMLTFKNLYNLEYNEILWHNLLEMWTRLIFLSHWCKLFQNSFRLETQIYEDCDRPVTYKWGLMTLVLCQKSQNYSFTLIGQV